jgi:hypothetical protein
MAVDGSMWSAVAVLKILEQAYTKTAASCIELLIHCTHAAHYVLPVKSVGSCCCRDSMCCGGIRGCMMDISCLLFSGYSVRLHDSRISVDSSPMKL